MAHGAGLAANRGTPEPDALFGSARRPRSPSPPPLRSAYDHTVCSAPLPATRPPRPIRPRPFRHRHRRHRLCFPSFPRVIVYACLFVCLVLFCFRIVRRAYLLSVAVSILSLSFCTTFPLLQLNV